MINIGPGVTITSVFNGYTPIVIGDAPVTLTFTNFITEDSNNLITENGYQLVEEN